jgi:hypothetical protein
MYKILRIKLWVQETRNVRDAKWWVWEHEREQVNMNEFF